MASSHKSARNKLGSWREVRPGVWEVRVSKGYRKDGSQRTKYATVKGSESDAIAEVVRLADEMGWHVGDTIAVLDAKGQTAEYLTRSSFLV